MWEGAACSSFTRRALAGLTCSTTSRGERKFGFVGDFSLRSRAFLLLSMWQVRYHRRAAPQNRPKHSNRRHDQGHDQGAKGKGRANFRQCVVTVHNSRHRKFLLLSALTKLAGKNRANRRRRNGRTHADNSRLLTGCRDERERAHNISRPRAQYQTLGRLPGAGLCSVDPKRVCRLNRGSSVRWNRGGHHRHDKQHQADGDEHDWIIQIDRPLGHNLVTAS